MVKVQGVRTIVSAPGSHIRFSVIFSLTILNHSCFCVFEFGGFCQIARFVHDHVRASQQQKALSVADILSTILYHIVSFPSSAAKLPDLRMIIQERRRAAEAAEKAVDVGEPAEAKEVHKLKGRGAEGRGNMRGFSPGELVVGLGYTCIYAEVL